MSVVPYNALEVAMLTQEQVECPVTHHFGPGIYIREVAIPAGTIVLGHSHTNPCTNILLSGSMAVSLSGGVVKVLTAPCTFVTQQGRKLAYIIEDVVFQNVFATDETDVAVLEATLIETCPDAATPHDCTELLENLRGIIPCHSLQPPS